VQKYRLQKAKQINTIQLRNFSTYEKKLKNEPTKIKRKL
jgi:hypothetical protein